MALLCFASLMGTGDLRLDSVCCSNSPLHVNYLSSKTPHLLCCGKEIPFHSFMSLHRGSQAADHCQEHLPRLLTEELKASSSPQEALKRAFLYLEQGVRRNRMCLTPLETEDIAL